MASYNFIKAIFFLLLLLSRPSLFFGTIAWFFSFYFKMGQAASITFSNKSDILYDIDDFSTRFRKATISTISVPMVIVAFPILNAYKFSENEYTGVKVVDGTIGGLLGVVGCKHYILHNVTFLAVLTIIFYQGHYHLLLLFGQLTKPYLPKVQLSLRKYLKRQKLQLGALLVWIVIIFIT